MQGARWNARLISISGSDVTLVAPPRDRYGYFVLGENTLTLGVEDPAASGTSIGVYVRGSVQARHTARAHVLPRICQCHRCIVTTPVAARPEMYACVRSSR